VTGARTTRAEVGVASEAVSYERAADMRYAGQGFEIVVQLPARALDSRDEPAIEAAFHQAYVEAFARDVEGVPIEALNWRLTASGPRPEPGLGAVQPKGPGPAVPKAERRAYFPEAGGFVNAPVYDRYSLAAGAIGHGPAIVEERESTLVIGPGGQFAVDTLGGILVEVT